MIQIVLYPGREDYAALLQRPHKDAADLGSVVAGVLQDVRLEGDKAVLGYEERFDKVRLASLVVSEEEMQEFLDSSRGLKAVRVWEVLRHE